MFTRRNIDAIQTTPLKYILFLTRTTNKLVWHYLLIKLSLVIRQNNHRNFNYYKWSIIVYKIPTGIGSINVWTIWQFR